jgi:hypothetical protein
VLRTLANKKSLTFSCWDIGIFKATNAQISNVPSSLPNKTDPTIVPEKKQTEKCPQTTIGCPQKQIIRFLSLFRKQGLASE